MKTKTYSQTKLNIALAAAMLTTFNSGLAVAAADEEMESIIVTANRTPQEQFLTLSATQVISKAEIKAMQPQNITELLDKIAGISVASQGGGGQQSSVFTRGTNSGHTLILIDGVRVNSATIGTTNFSTMSASLIERIEVVKGPRAALWGSDAIGGVIQIFTKRLYSGEAELSAGIGSHNYWKTSAAIGLGDSEHSLTLSVAAENSDGFNIYRSTGSPYEIDEPDKDGYDRTSISAVGESHINEQFSLHLVGRYEDGTSAFDASYPNSPCWDDPAKICPAYYANEGQNTNYSVKVASEYKNDSVFAELAISTSSDEGATFGNGIKKSDASIIETTRDQVAFLTSYNFTEMASVTGGVDWYKEKVTSNSVVYDIDSRDVSAVFLQTRHQINSLLLEGAVRRDDVEGLDAETTYNVSIGYQVSNDWLVSASHSTGFKAPTFNDLYWPFSGNENLLPETTASTELLVRKRFSDGSVEFSFFDSEIENLIAWAPIDPDNEYSLWQPDNVAAADIQGIEMTANIQTGDFSHIVALAYLKTEDRATGEALLRRPELTANYSLGYQWQDFTFNGVVSYRDESAENAYTMLEDYWLLDFSASYQATERLLITAKANNVLDEAYETAKSYVADGRNYLLTVSYSFD